MLVVLHGDDTVRAGHEFARLRAEVDPDGLNTTLLDDPRTTVDEVIQAAGAVPFFGGQRFVGVRGFLLRLSRPGERGRSTAESRGKALDELAGHLAGLPATTVLVFWEPAAIKLPASIERLADRIASFDVPARVGDMQPWLEDWLLNRARDQGVALTADAANRLAAMVVANIRAVESGDRDQRVGIELQRLATELVRLGTYAGVGGKVDGRVVSALTPDARAQVFELVEAVATRATPRALRLLDQALAEGLEPLVLLRLLERQLSALLRAAAVGGDARSIETGLKVPNWLARRYAQQVRALGHATLRQSHARLLAADLAIKSGQATADAAVRDLVLALCLTGRAPALRSG